MKTTINQTLADGIKILLLFEPLTPSLTVPQISQILGYGQGKTYRMIRTLVQFGFLQGNAKEAQYSLGLNALRIGLLAQQNFSLSSIAYPLMKELSSLTKETVLLTMVNGTKGICVERVESEEPIRFSKFHPGAILPLHCGASSKILMAYLEEKQWDRIIAEEGLRKYTEKTVTDPDQLKAHLRMIRKKGYALSDEEVTPEVRAVAAPIFNSLGELAGGLGIAGPAYRIDKRKMHSLATLAVQFAQRISSELGPMAGAALNRKISNG